MIRAGFALAALLWSSAAAAEFRPVEDRPYRHDTVETRTADGVVRRFHASRTVIFHKTATGYDVTVTLDAVNAQAGGDVGAMFRAATGALLNRPLRYRLDASGAIIGVEDADAAIAVIADAIERISAHPERKGDARVLASPLRSLPLERKAAMLRSILTPVLAGPSADRRPVSDRSPCPAARRSRRARHSTGSRRCHATPAESSRSTSARAAGWTRLLPPKRTGASSLVPLRHPARRSARSAIWIQRAGW